MIRDFESEVMRYLGTQNLADRSESFSLGADMSVAVLTREDHVVSHAEGFVEASDLAMLAARLQSAARLSDSRTT